MLEISLFFILTFITLIDAFKSRLIFVILKIIPSDPQIKSIAADISVLEKELSTISMVHEFAKYFKLQRRITKLKDDKKILGDEKVASSQEELQRVKKAKEYYYKNRTVRCHKGSRTNRSLCSPVQIKNQAFRVMKIRYSLMTALYVIILGSLVTLVWLYRSEPVAQIPATWLWPVSSYFDWSNYVPGSITVPCWVAISSSAAKTLAKHF